MSSEKFVTIRELKDGDRIENRKVRVIHRWTRPAYMDKKKTESIELLLIDEMNQIIQGTVRKQVLLKFTDSLEVGVVYTIKNVSVSHNVGYEKATPALFRLYFEYSSKVIPFTGEHTIPEYGFRFANFEDIINGRVATTHYIDLVGKLFEVGPLIETKNGFKCRTIKLEDVECCQIPCTLWSPHSVDLPELLQKQTNPQQSPVVVLQCIKVRKFDGWRLQTTYNATKIHFGLDIPEVAAFCNSFSTPAPSNSLQVIDKVEEEEEVDVLTLDNIKTINEIKENEKPGYFYTYGRIIDLECKSGWYYNSCNRCRSKATKNEQGRWKCNRAGCEGNINGYNSSDPKFQVNFLVSDFGDDKVNFVGFDSQIGDFLEPSAKQLRDRLEKDGKQDSIPDEFEFFINKNFIFKIHISERYNVEHGKHSYTITKMSDDPQMFENWMNKCNERVKRDMTILKHSTEQIATITDSAQRQLESLRGSVTKEIELPGLSNLQTPLQEACDIASIDSTSKPTTRKRTIPAIAFNLEDDSEVEASSSTKGVESRKKEKLS